MDLPICPKNLRGHCAKSDVVCLSEADGGGGYYTFGCRTCRTGFALSNPRGKAAGALDREIKRKQSLRPTAKDRVTFDIGRLSR